jgi:hypothetical protein
MISLMLRSGFRINTCSIETHKIMDVPLFLPDKKIFFHIGHFIHPELNLLTILHALEREGKE